MGRRRYVWLTVALVATMTVNPQIAIQGTNSVPGEGICTAAARQAMPGGGGHDHGDINQHQLSCQMRQVFYDSLSDELAARNDVILGEMESRMTWLRSPWPSRNRACFSSTSRTQLLRCSRAGTAGRSVRPW